ncbi:MAG: YihY/virulence factor BrkB family protein [Chthoniobacterales bacterium]|nr:YihY/virulence factor BrkB family protein [Chthoniobacterales bacterium]
MYSAMDVAKTKPLEEAVPRKEKKSPRQILGEAFNRYVMEGGMTHGAALTYYAVFSLGPLLLVATAIAGWFFGENEARGELHVKLTEMFGVETATTIEGLLASVRARTSSGWAATIGIVVLLYTSSSVMRQLRDSMNFIWRVPHKREATWWMWAEHYLVSLAGVLVAGLLLVISLIATTALAVMKKYVPDGLPYSATFLLSMEFLATLIMVTMVCAMVFKFLPETKVLWRYVWLGAFGTGLLFSIGKLGMGLYLGWLSAESFYGAMSSFMILLFWMYYSAQVLVIGGYFTEMFSSARMAAKAARGKG